MWWTNFLMAWGPILALSLAFTALVMLYNYVWELREELKHARQECARFYQDKAFTQIRLSMPRKNFLIQR